MGLMGLISIISSLRANWDLERIESRNHRVYAPIYRGASGSSRNICNSNPERLIRSPNKLSIEPTEREVLPCSRTTKVMTN